MSNEGNIKASIFLILLKCIVVGYSNENESFTNRLFSNYGPLNMLFHFFRCLFHEAFVKKSMKKLFFFNFKFQKSILRGSILQKNRMSNFVILKWWPFEYQVKGWKFVDFWDCFFRNKNADILNFSWIKYFGNDFSFLKKWHIWVYYCWNYGP